MEVRPVSVEPQPVVKELPLKLLDWVVLAPIEIIVDEEPVPEPVPGREPLIVETVMVERVSPLATILDVNIVEP